MSVMLHRAAVAAYGAGLVATITTRTGMGERAPTIIGPVWLGVYVLYCFSGETLLRSDALPTSKPRLLALWTWCGMVLVILFQPFMWHEPKGNELQRCSDTALLAYLGIFSWLLGIVRRTSPAAVRRRSVSSPDKDPSNPHSPGFEEQTVGVPETPAFSPLHTNIAKSSQTMLDVGAVSSQPSAFVDSAKSSGEVEGDGGDAQYVYESESLNIVRPAMFAVMLHIVLSVTVVMVEARFVSIAWGTVVANHLTGATVVIITAERMLWLNDLQRRLETLGELLRESSELLRQNRSASQFRIANGYGSEVAALRDFLTLVELLRYHISDTAFEYVDVVAPPAPLAPPPNLNLSEIATEPPQHPNGGAVEGGAGLFLGPIPSPVLPLERSILNNSGLESSAKNPLRPMSAHGVSPGVALQLPLHPSRIPASVRTVHPALTGSRNSLPALVSPGRQNRNNGVARDTLSQSDATASAPRRLRQYMAPAFSVNQHQVTVLAVELFPRGSDQDRLLSLRGFVTVVNNAAAAYGGTVANIFNGRAFILWRHDGAAVVACYAALHVRSLCPWTSLWVSQGKTMAGHVRGESARAARAMFVVHGVTLPHAEMYLRLCRRLKAYVGISPDVEAQIGRVSGLQCLPIDQVYIGGGSDAATLYSLLPPTATCTQAQIALFGEAFRCGMHKMRVELFISVARGCTCRVMMDQLWRLVEISAQRRDLVRHFGREPFTSSESHGYVPGRNYKAAFQRALKLRNSVSRDYFARLQSLVVLYEADDEESEDACSLNVRAVEIDLDVREAYAESSENNSSERPPAAPDLDSTLPMPSRSPACGLLVGDDGIKCPFDAPPSPKSTRPNTAKATSNARPLTAPKQAPRPVSAAASKRGSRSSQ